MLRCKPRVEPLAKIPPFLSLNSQDGVWPKHIIELSHQGRLVYAVGEFLGAPGYLLCDFIVPNHAYRSLNGTKVKDDKGGIA